MKAEADEMELLSREEKVAWTSALTMILVTGLIASFKFEIPYPLS